MNLLFLWLVFDAPLLNNPAETRLDELKKDRLVANLLAFLKVCRESAVSRAAEGVKCPTNTQAKGPPDRNRISGERLPLKCEAIHRRGKPQNVCSKRRISQVNWTEGQATIDPSSKWLLSLLFGWIVGNLYLLPIIGLPHEFIAKLRPLRRSPYRSART